MPTTMRNPTSVCCPRCGNDRVVMLRPRIGVSESESDLKVIVFECHECLLGWAFSYEQLAKKQCSKSA